MHCTGRRGSVYICSHIYRGADDPTRPLQTCNRLVLYIFRFSVSFRFLSRLTMSLSTHNSRRPSPLRPTSFDPITPVDGAPVLHEGRVAVITGGGSGIGAIDLQGDTFPLHTASLSDRATGLSALAIGSIYKFLFLPGII